MATVTATWRWADGSRAVGSASEAIGGDLLLNQRAKGLVRGFGGSGGGGISSEI